MRSSVILGPVVGLVVGSRAPVVLELSLGVVALYPVEYCVHGFGVVWLDVVGNNAMCCAVVSLDWHWGLHLAHLFEEVSHQDCFAGVDVEDTKFGFGCTGHDGLEYLGDAENGAIVGWVIDVRQTEIMAANLTSY